MSVDLRLGDSREVLRTLADESVDAVVCDPPYEYGFMGKAWDGTGIAHDKGFWAEVFRVLKPGGHLIAFSSTRTSHRMVCAIEDVGFQVRDTLHWCYWSGFPKSLDISKEMDRLAGAEREVVGARNTAKGMGGSPNDFGRSAVVSNVVDITAPSTDAAKLWSGYGTALKPAVENASLSMKPHTLASLCGRLALDIRESVCRLRSHVKGAKKDSASSLAVHGADTFGSAQWLAVEKCSTPVDLFDLMATLSSGSTVPTSLSTAFLWLRTLVAISERRSTFTTETESEMITALITLSCSPSPITPGCMLEVSTRSDGIGSSAWLVADTFNALRWKLRLTRTHSAGGPATSTARNVGSHPDGLAEAVEPATLARKPLAESSIARQVLATGTGALNLDACRFAPGDPMWPGPDGGADALAAKHESTRGLNTMGATNTYGEHNVPRIGIAHTLGRFPANLLHCPKASRSEREAGCDGLPAMSGAEAIGRKEDTKSMVGANRTANEVRNPHPTVKPIRLMRWLCRLVGGQPGSVILDPFLGSGTTGIAAMAEGFSFIGVEMSPEYMRIAAARISHYATVPVDVPDGVDVPDPEQATLW